MNEFESFKSFIEEELLHTSENPASSRRVIAVTQGLGLESPKRPEAAEPAATRMKAQTQAHVKQPAQVKTPTATMIDEFVAEPPPSKVVARAPELPPRPARTPETPFEEPVKPEVSLASVMAEPPPLVAPAPRRRSSSEVNPPPLPELSPLRRLLAVMIDQILVLTIFMTTLVVTSNFLTGFETGFSIEVLKSFSNPLFARFAMVQFALIWCSYFVISAGLFNATFGMWVWGMRICFGPTDSGYPLRRLMRIFWSVLFFAPIFPLVLLIFRKNGRNLLDTLSGSNLYMAS